MGVLETLFAAAVGGGIVAARPLARRFRIRGYTRGRRLRSKKPTTRVTGDRETGVRFGNAYLPESSVTQHTLVAGSTGSGKTQIQRLFMREPLRRITPGSDHRALVYDSKGEMAVYLRRVGVTAPVFSLNPFVRSNDFPKAVAWDLGRDITSPTRALNFAASLVKGEQGANAYFSDSARLVVGGIITSWVRRGVSWTLSDLVNATRTRSRMVEVLSSDSEGIPVAEEFLPDDRTGHSVSSTVVSNLGYFAPIAAMWQRAEHKISLGEWLRSSSILLMGDNETATETLDVLNKLIFTYLAEEMIQQDNSSTRRNYVWVDELRLARGILQSEKLERLAVKGRSRGVALVLAFQSIEGFRKVAGRETADEVVDQCGSIALLRNSGEGAKWASTLTGQHETIEVHHSDSSRMLAAENRSEQRVLKETVLASEFQALPETNKKNGLHGVFVSLERGAELVRVSPGDIEEVVVSEEEESRDAPKLRPESDQWLRDWTPSDFKRLGSERSVEREREEHRHEADLRPPSSKKLKLRLRRADGVEEVRLPKAVV